MDTVIRADENPDMVNQLLNQMEQVAATTEISIPEEADAYVLPDTFVTLPGGWLTTDGDLVTEAEVRELTGEDEEALARITSPGKLLLEILQRGTVKVGDEKATRKVLDSLLSGDRDALLLAIRRVTFGDDVSYQSACSACGEFGTFEIDLSTDIDMRPLEDQNDRVFSVETKAGVVEATLPTGITQRELMSSTDKTVAEVNTALLAGCVLSVNGMPSLGVSTVKRLGIRDREKITLAIAERNPGPRFNDVKKECPECGGEATLSMSLAALFLL